MAGAAVITVRTHLIVRIPCPAALPAIALDRGVYITARVSSIVLPVVSVDAAASIMRFGKWTELRFIEVQVKIDIEGIVVDKLTFDLLL